VAVICDTIYANYVFGMSSVPKTFASSTRKSLNRSPRLLLVQLSQTPGL